MFPISPRNSAAAVAHLLTTTGASHVLIGPEPVLQGLAAAAFKSMQDTRTQLPTTSTMPIFEDLVRSELEPEFKFLPSFEFNLSDRAMVLHSSGSTAFPKLIYGWHYRSLMSGLFPFFGVQDLTGVRLGFHAMPMYHGMGIQQLGWTATCGVVLCVFQPLSPATVPAPENTLKALVSSKCELTVCVPSFIEIWAKKPEDVRAMKQIGIGIMFGGGPLAKHIGDQLADEGIALFSAYGCTEVGFMQQIIPNHPGKDWEYINLNVGALRTHWIRQPDGTAELVVKPSRFVLPAVINTTVNGEDAFATNDLFIPHPTRPGYWKVFGRADDQIIHSTGEKTNPGPLESMLDHDPHVNRCLIFGRGRFNAGVLVEPKPACKLDPSDTEALAAFRNSIWPTVVKVNDYAPQHSRLFKEMILVTSSSKPFTYTAKNTPRRQAIINDYEPEIEALYTAAAETTQAGDLTPPSIWDLSSTAEFIKLVVSRVVKSALADTDDIFQKGCDSLQATWIRNSILHALRESTQVDTRSIPGGFVYQYPTIRRLAQYVSSLALPQMVEQVNFPTDSQTIVTAMLAMVDKYRGNWPKHTSLGDTANMVTVLITGTTGSLGAALLAKLMQTPDIEHVYALNRINNEGSDLLTRQKARLVEWGYDPNIVDSSKVTFIEADMSTDHLGLSAETYQRICSSVTYIIHNAYRVNFNLSLASFESNVKTVRHLIDLALSSPQAVLPRLLFVSTIGVLGRFKGDGPIKEEPVDASSAISSGYTQSKWVNEELLSIVGKETPLRPTTIRVGQVAGSTTGAWNRTEWFPSLVKSSTYLGCLPMLNQHISWVPVDAAAQAILEMRSSSYSSLHLAHPRPVPWSTIITPIAIFLSLPLATYSEWIRRLQKSGENFDMQSEMDMMKANPALQIIEFFSHADTTEGSREAMGLPEMNLQKAQEVAPALSEKNLPQLCENDALRWLAYW